ncbi:MAG TPA: TetR/AcrR family transcriptional regulator [Iamia sp.]|nr:TetR/AcrR family transcriptional regulator [Iamia sp.]
MDADTTDRVTRPSADPTRDRILAAALDLFSERSFKDATTREIALRAGVTQPLLNYHYRSKDELWRAAVDALFEKLRSSMSDRLEGLRGVDARTSAMLMVRDFITFSARNPQLHRIITQECKFDGPRMDYLVERHVRPLYDTTIELFEQLARDGAVPPIPAPHLYYILTGAGPAMFVLGPECRRLSGLDPTSDAVIEAHADAVCQLLFGEPLDSPRPVP